MKNFRDAPIVVLTAALFATAACIANAAVPIDLGTLGPNTLNQNFSEGAKLNSFNEVTGLTTAAGPATIQPFYYTNPFMVGIFPSSRPGQGHDINDNGLIVGQTVVSGPVGRAFQHIGGVTTLLPPLAPLARSVAYGTNNLNDVVGVSQTGVTNSTGTLWTVGTPSALPLSIARDISDNRLVVGDRLTSPVSAWAYDINTNTSIPMGTLGGNLSRASAVNNAGEATGFSADANNNWHAYIWDSGNGMTNLGGASTGAIESFGLDINNTGTVVGYLNFSGIHRAFCWIDGQLTDLNTLLSPNSGWILEQAHGVNDQGWITGYGSFNGQRRGFLFQHIPEPSSVLLLASGLVGLSLKRRRI